MTDVPITVPGLSGGTFDALYRSLSEQLAAYPSGKPLGPSKVALNSIRTAPALFEARSSGQSEDHGGSHGHAVDLERVLTAMPEGQRYFDPITVFEVAGQDYCLDGHHRLAVYRKVLRAGDKVPVKRIGGTLADAVAEAVRANSALFLPMTASERQEAAWKLVKIGHGSKREQAALSGMGESFIAKLRRLKKALEESHPEAEWGSLWEAERLARGDHSEPDEWTEEKQAAEVEEYRRRLLKTFGDKLHRRTPAVVIALVDIVGPEVFREAVREVFDDAVGFLFEDPEGCDF